MDISLVPSGTGHLEVRLRPDLSFDGIVSNVVFTVRWNTASGAHLGGIQQNGMGSLHVPLMKSDVEYDQDGWRYQIFVSVGMNPMVAHENAWQAGQEYTIGTITVQGASEFSLVNDGWTEAHNGDYFVSLGGLDHTGVIYQQLSTGLEELPPAGDDLDIMPNPTDRESVITFTPNGPETLQLQLLDAQGRVIWERSLGTVQGPWRGTLDMAPHAAGVYLLRLQGGGRETVRRVVRK